MSRRSDVRACAYSSWRAASLILVLVLTQGGLADGRQRLETTSGTSTSLGRQRRHVPSQLTASSKSARVPLDVARGGAVVNSPKKGAASAATAAKPSLLNVDPALVTAVSGALFMAALEHVVKKLLKNQGISFPAPLASCLFLLVFLLLLEPIQPKWANGLHQYLTPGAALLAKWLPVFFVPGLAMLPLAPSVGGPSEVIKVIGVAIIGFLYTIFTTVGAVLALRKAQGTLVVAAGGPSPPPTKAGGRKAAPALPSTPPPSPPFSDATLGRLVQLSALLGGASLLLTTLAESKVNGDVLHMLKTGFFATSTIAAYVWGARLPSSFTTIVHPLVVASTITLLLVASWGSLTSQSFHQVLKSYKVGSLQWNRLGAGDLLLYLLGPAVVSFSLSMYGRRQLLKQNWMVVGLAMLVSSAGGLYGTAGFVRLIKLGASSRDGGKLVRLSVLARNVTTALAIALTSMLGGDISICASVVVLTGIVGATYGKTLLSKVGIVDPVARGLAIGSSSQGLGVASLGNEPDAFPFAAMGMVLTAIAATTLVSIPAVKSSIIRVAMGS